MSPLEALVRILNNDVCPCADDDQSTPSKHGAICGVGCKKGTSRTLTGGFECSQGGDGGDGGVVLSSSAGSHASSSGVGSSGVATLDGDVHRTEALLSTSPGDEPV